VREAAGLTELLAQIVCEAATRGRGIITIELRGRSPAAAAVIPSPPPRRADAYRGIVLNNAHARWHAGERAEGPMQPGSRA